MAGVTEKVLPHLESMQPDSILDRVNDIEKYERLARRKYIGGVLFLSDYQLGLSTHAPSLPIGRSPSAILQSLSQSASVAE